MSISTWLITRASSGLVMHRAGAASDLTQVFGLTAFDPASTVQQVMLLISARHVRFRG